jgi:hypothetical protein
MSFDFVPGLYLPTSRQLFDLPSNSLSRTFLHSTERPSENINFYLPGEGLFYIFNRVFESSYKEKKEYPLALRTTCYLWNEHIDHLLEKMWHVLQRDLPQGPLQLHDHWLSSSTEAWSIVRFQQFNQKVRSESNSVGHVIPSSKRFMHPEDFEGLQLEAQMALNEAPREHDTTLQLYWSYMRKEEGFLGGCHMLGDVLPTLPADIVVPPRGAPATEIRTFFDDPRVILALTGITKLNLSTFYDNRWLPLYPRLRRLPSEIAFFTGLTHLHLRSTSIKTFPEGITNLSELKHLNLSDNHFSVIPDSIAKLKNLQILFIHQCRIKHFPASITTLDSLVKLDLRENGMIDISRSLANFTELKFLDLRQNEICYIPDSVSTISKLIYLNLSKNHINHIPDSLAKLSQLEILVLNENQITCIPDSLGALTQLKGSHFGKNPLGPWEKFTARFKLHGPVLFETSFHIQQTIDYFNQDRLPLFKT